MDDPGGEDAIGGGDPTVDSRGIVHTEGSEDKTIGVFPVVFSL